MEDHGPMGEGDVRMREVLIQLGLLSNGRTTSYTASGGGDPNHVPTLGAFDAPHLHFALEWDAAEDGEQRRRVYDAARRRLAEEKRGPGLTVHVVVKTRAQLDARIVNDGEGVAADEVAIQFRTGVTIVRKAREAAGRETEYGTRPRAAREMSADERDAEARRLADERGMSARQIGVSLGCSYNTARRALGRL